MKTSFVASLVLSAVAIVIAVGGYLYPQTLVSQPGQSDGLFGATGTRFPHGITIGDVSVSPTNLAKVISGTCDLVGADASVAASSTAVFDCVVAGARSGDVVFAQIGTSTQNTSVLNWSVQSAKASSTSGFITIALTNFSGAAAVPSATQVGSSTRYFVIRSQ